MLATAKNGFFTRLETGLAERLAPLDGAALGGDRTDASLHIEIATLLGYWPGPRAHA